MKRLIPFLLLPFLTGCWAGANFRARQNEKWGAQMLATNSTIMPPLPPVRAVQRSQPAVVKPAIASVRVSCLETSLVPNEVLIFQSCTNLATPIWKEEVRMFAAPSNSWIDTNLAGMPVKFYRAENSL
ncbi:MAG: hypothetical protein KGL39_30255 [Patescibacteria group bacterium]|nr:hypothetical protein [Patescibacteria group bacterium]